ncbi:MAG: Na+/H+ antiporter [Eggerthellaceae bacterium]|nr:Na+/H+ antiporter [Eggerthellaceae bacterium]
METFELILVMLACVIVSALIEPLLKRLALPLVQILVGFVAALVLPGVADVSIDPELFLVLFIAPLLFNEAREASNRTLWRNKGAIISLAVGLVLVTVLVVGFALNLMVPSIPLAAAFACAAALGPTDAAAVGALGSTIKLTERQKTLLSGESLINDASGVVSFEFAIAAATTGVFSATDAGQSFLFLFFGGIIFGLVVGFIAFASMIAVRRRGYQNTTVHVLYEVITPFAVFLAAEAFHVSGILAVVAAGLVMGREVPHIESSSLAKQQMISESFWEIIVFLINGVIFVLLGMQLPHAMSPTLASAFDLPQLIGIILVMTLLVEGIRFIWVSIMELQHVDPETGKRGIENVGATLRSALVTTIAGPKGAVTLSIIFTIPFLMPDQVTAFPNRDLIIFLTAGVILCTLVIANVFLPIVAPKPDAGLDEVELRRAEISVLTAVVAQLRAMVRENEGSEYEPAMRLTIARYRTRLARERFQVEGCGDIMRELVSEVLRLQQERADELQLGAKDAGKFTEEDAAPYYAMLRGIRSSIGYFDNAQNVGSRFYGIRGAIALLRERIHPTVIADEQSERIYYDTCRFAIDLEHVAIDYLDSIANDENDPRAQVAATLAAEHRSSLDSLWARINYGQDTDLREDGPIAHEAASEMPEGMQQTFGDQFRKARQYADEVDAVALEMELEEIRRQQMEGEMPVEIANQLRESVYVLQMHLG